MLTILIVQVAGPSHCPTFTVEVSLASMTCQGSGPKKNTAKQEAARRMLARMDSAIGGSESSTEDDILSHDETLMENQYYSLASEPDSLDPIMPETQPNPVSTLQELCQKRQEGPKKPLPTYQDFPTPPGGVGRFCIQCSLGSLRTEGLGSNKESFRLICKIFI